MNILLLIAGTIAIMIFSWFFSIKHKRYHGIPRFFAFESIYILLLLNARLWFREPLSWHQVISWIFLISSVYPGIAGYLLLKKRGKSSESFENTTVLVKESLYKYIRHPLYSSLLFFGTGVMFKDPGIYQIIAGGVLIVAITFTALTEEKEMISKFGNEYREYMKETKMFVPFLV